MTLCFVIDDITLRAGTERAQTNLANALAARGHCVHIWSCYRRQTGPAYPLADPVRVTYGLRRGPNSLRRSPLRYLIDYLWLMGMLFCHIVRRRPDWMICTDTNRVIVALPALLVPGVRLAVWEHFAISHSITKFYGRIARRIASRFANTLVTLTPRDRETYRQLYKPRGTIVSIPNIVIIPARETTARRKEVLAVGRLTHQKGFDLLLEAWEVASASLPDWSLLIVGEGELKAELTAKVRSLAARDRVTLAPFTDDPFTLYSRCGMFVLSSRFEGLPLVLAEAMGCGSPCISFDCPNGPRELIRPGQNGLLVPAEQPLALAETIVRLATDDALRLRLGSAAASSVANFSEEAISSRWRDVLCL